MRFILSIRTGNPLSGNDSGHGNPGGVLSHSIREDSPESSGPWAKAHGSDCVLLRAVPSCPFGLDRHRLAPTPFRDEKL